MSIDHRQDTIINNRFRIFNKLGEGGFGTVFLVHDQGTDEICALKLLKPALASQRNLQEKFRQEALIWMEFERHRNIVNVRAVDIFNGRLFVALEYVPPGELGDNCLDKVIRKRRISAQTAIKWGIEVCDALTYANSKGMIAHRDLKPSNLMVDPEGVIKVTDFGLALFSADPSYYSFDTSPSGTPVYMPPEQFRHGASIDQRSDIYSFGMVLFEIMTGGQLPFHMGSTDPNNYFEHFHKLHLTYELPRLDTPLYPVIARCLRKKPEQRYQSFNEVRQVLLMLFEQETGRRFIPPSPEELNASEHNNFAVSYQMLGDLKRAMKHVDLAIRAAPNYIPAYNNKAACLAESGNIKDALAIWTKLTEEHPDLGRPFYNLGNYQMQIGNAREAVRLFEEATRREPDYIPAVVNAAIAYQQLHDASNSIKYYQRAIELSPSDAQIYYNYGFLMYQGGDFQDAIKLLTHTIKLNPDHLSALNYLGLCHLELGRPEGAIGYFDQALRIDSSYAYAIENKKLAVDSLRQKKGLFGRLFGKD